MSRRDLPDSRRRIFLAGALVAFAVAGLSRLRLWRTGESDSFALAKRLLGLLGLAEYRAANVAAVDSTISNLVEDLLGEDPVRAASRSDADLRERLRRRIVHDYETGRIRSVQGWLLSITEGNALHLARRVSLAASPR